MTIQHHFARIRRFIDSKPLISLLTALTAILLIIVIFEAGVLFGMHEARSSYRWGEGYARNFGGPKEGFMSQPGALPNGHGTFGRVSSVTLPTFVITDPNHPEEKVRIGTGTIIKNGDQTVTTAALTNDAFVVVLGSPADDGVIDATLIRIIPAPPDGGVGMASSSAPMQIRHMPQQNAQ